MKIAMSSDNSASISTGCLLVYLHVEANFRGVRDNLSDMPIWNPIMDEFSGQILISQESKINVSTEKVVVPANP